MEPPLKLRKNSNTWTPISGMNLNFDKSMESTTSINAYLETKIKLPRENSKDQLMYIPLAM